MDFYRQYYLSGNREKNSNCKRGAGFLVRWLNSKNHAGSGNTLIVDYTSREKSAWLFQVQLVEPEGVARVQNTEEIIAFCPIFSATKVRLKSKNKCYFLKPNLLTF